MHISDTKIIRSKDEFLEYAHVMAEKYSKYENELNLLCSESENKKIDIDGYCDVCDKETKNLD